MSDQISVELALELFVDDEGAMRTAGFDRLKEAWSKDEDFPYEDPDGVPLDVVINSLLADALPLKLPGFRRGPLQIEKTSLRQVDDSDEGDTGEQSDSGESDAGESDSVESDAGESDAGESDDAAESDSGESPARRSE